MSLFEWKNFFSRPATLDYAKASPVQPRARGVPVPVRDTAGSCADCGACERVCPARAVKVEGPRKLAFDYGACLQCGLCVQVCPEQRLEDSGLTHAFALERDTLKVTFDGCDFEPREEKVPENVERFRKMTGGRGLNYREVAAGNNSVECELNASFNNLFDSESLGIRSVASPKHADTVLFSGPVGPNMVGPLQTAWDTMPEPKALVACGTEAVSGGLFPMGQRPKTPDLFIAGDPPRPDTVLNAFRYLMGRLRYSFQHALRDRVAALRQP
jgi:Ni,Fe-hydrogenase III small subunit/Pyruvate/2-oxoacid:ferredoxin oxidoreductase delta subunit